jgi:hypothetical protein
VNFQDDRHALYVGWVMGMAHQNGLDAEPVVDAAGNYTDRFLIDVGGQQIALVVPYPPDDWTLNT